MNEKTAKEKGYEFTGIYSFNKGEVMPRLAAIKAKGYKAVVAFVPGDPLSRCHRSGGYSVMVEPRMLLDETAKSYRDAVNSQAAAAASIMKAAIDKANAEIAELTARNEHRVAWLAENGYTLSPAV